MIKFLIKKVVPDSENINNKDVRERYGLLAGGLGIICNLVLFGIKITIGLLMNSIAIISDAINNLSDMCSSVITIIGAKISNRRADRNHPFGHGRAEYIASFVVAFIIILVGFELFTSSISKIFNPEKVMFSFPLFIILIASILIKVWMFSYNRYIGKKINSSIMIATATDSLNDCIATIAVIISIVIGCFTTLPIDGIMGVIVSGLIIYTGFKVAKEIAGVLIGQPPSKEFIKEITDFVMSFDGIVGVHDFLAHDYGPSSIIASLHAEVPDDINIVKVHETIDEIERQVLDKYEVVLVIHMDPISLNCEKTNKAREMVKNIISNMNKEFSIHDFRMVDGENNINLIFDLVVPIEMKNEEKTATLEELKNRIKEVDNRFNIVVQIDNGY